MKITAAEARELVESYTAGLIEDEVNEICRCIKDTATNGGVNIIYYVSFHLSACVGQALVDLGFKVTVDPRRQSSQDGDDQLPIQIIWA